MAKKDKEIVVDLNELSQLLSGMSLAPENEEQPRYSKKEKMRHLAKKSKKGALDNNGKELSEFQRGRNLGRAEEIGNQLGQFKYSKSNEKGKAEIKAKQAEIKAKKDKEHAEYLKKKGKRG